jgi:anthranilate phosphoribosyltransferase
MMPQPLRATLEQLLDRRSLGETEAGELLVALTDPEVAPAMAGALLAALRMKGVTADEVRGFAGAMRRLARRPQISAGGPIVDIVGTGGDGSGSLNLSTGAALLAAACGLRVVKHGNRAVSSRCGSADLLEALGMSIPLDEITAGRCLDATGFTFLFAPHYHPALKVLAPVRGALGVRTVFNMLGPLANPAEPPFHLIGAFSLEAAELMAKTLSGMAIERAFVVHGDLGWDEPTPAGPFTLFDVRPGEVAREMRESAHFGLKPCDPADLAGGNVAHNAAALHAVFESRDKGAHRDALVIGAALALELLGREQDPRAAAALAEGAIDSGRARELLEKISRFGASAS